jgi:hypothetical protein
MRDVELYQQLLGLVAPWTVGRVELSVQSERLGGERPRRATEHVAGELIEQDNQRKAIVWFRFPFFEFFPRPEFVERQEPGPDLLIESRVLLEPELAVLAEPEFEDFVGVHSLQ